MFVLPTVIHAAEISLKFTPNLKRIFLRCQELRFILQSNVSLGKKKKKDETAKVGGVCLKTLHPVWYSAMI